MSAEITGLRIVAEFAQYVNNKVFLITGPSPESLGAAIAKSLCTNCTPALLLLLGRSEPGALVKSLMDLNPAVKAIFIPCDLASLSSVRAAADRVIAVTSKIHVIINSAGIMAPPIFTKSADGIEMQFATNHVGPFLLTELLVGRLIAAGEEEGARVVNLTSTGHLISDIRYEDLNFEDGAVYNPWSAYGQSKTANILYALSLAQKLAKYRIQAYSVHPGHCHTQLQKHMTAESASQAYALISKRVSEGTIPALNPEDFRSHQEAIWGVMRAALDPSLTFGDKASTGAFLINGEPTTRFLAPYAFDKSNAEKLWQFTERLVGEEFRN